MTDRELQSLRQRLDRLDKQLVGLVAERQRVVAEIGAHKHAGGRPLRDFAREREVLERAAASAGAAGLHGDIARDIMERLIHHSLTNQEQDRLQVSARGAGRSALVIGGAGRMGQWMARFLDAQGFSVRISDPAATDDNLFPVIDADGSENLDDDIIVVAAPLRVSAGILEQLAVRQPPGLIFDVGSLKQPLRAGHEALLQAGCRVTSVHPMFGPDVLMLSGQHVLMVDVGDTDATQDAARLFEPTMAEVTHLSLEEHDRVMAWVLGLSHLLNIAFASSLRAAGEDQALLQRVSSTTFGKQLDLARAVVSENPALYFEIQHLNPSGATPASVFSEQLAQLMQRVSEGDERAFVACMDAARQHLPESSRR